MIMTKDFSRHSCDDVRHSRDDLRHSRVGGNPVLKKTFKDINGIFLLDKPIGISSNHALQQAKRLFQAKKAGHCGTLDPIASGLLMICFGEATKFSQFLLESDKRYLVSGKLGVRTETGDTEGQMIAEKDASHITPNQIEHVLKQFRGEIWQTPSMYSAIKHQGQPLYKLARQGITVEREARKICIRELNFIALEDGFLTLEIAASKGTYVRTLIDDIGEALGCGAHVSMLRRTQVGPYHAAQMITLKRLEEAVQQNDHDFLRSVLLPVDSTVSDWPDVRLSEAAAYYIKQGQPVIVPYAPTEGWVRLMLRDDRFLGVGEILDDGRVAPRRLITQYS